MLLLLQRLAQLQSQMEDARVVSKQSEKLLRMWEALASRAQQVPVVCLSLPSALTPTVATLRSQGTNRKLLIVSTTGFC